MRHAHALTMAFCALLTLPSPGYSEGRLSSSNTDPGSVNAQIVTMLGQEIWALRRANAARCAGDQGPAAYWNMHDKLFSGMQDWSGQDPLAVFRQYAEELDLDLGEFTSCVESNKFKSSWKIY